MNMKLPIDSNSNIVLSENDKYRLNLILQGTQRQPGCHISHLKFNKGDDQFKEISNFIALINKTFRGIFQIIQNEEYLVPVLANRGAMNYNNRNMGRDDIALGALILLYKFANNSSPTQKNLEEKLKGTTLGSRNLRNLLNKLVDMQWLSKKTMISVDYYEPTPVLEACISLDALKRIFSKLYTTQKDQELLPRFFPKEYLVKQRSIGQSLDTLIQKSQNTTQKTKEDDEIEYST